MIIYILCLYLLVLVVDARPVVEESWQTQHKEWLDKDLVSLEEFRFQHYLYEVVFGVTVEKVTTANYVGKEDNKGD